MFALAFLARIVPFLRNEYTPWQDFNAGGDITSYFLLAFKLAAAADDQFAFLGNVGNMPIVAPLQAGLFRLFGIYPGFVVVGYVFAVIGSLAPVLLALAVQTAVGSRLGGVLAGYLLALNPLAIQYSLLTMSDGMGLVLFTLTLWLFYLSLRSNRPVLGLAFGMSAALLLVSRRTGWAVGIVAWMVFDLILRLIRHQRSMRSRRWRDGMKVALPVLGFLVMAGAVEAVAGVSGHPGYFARQWGSNLAVALGAHGLDLAQGQWPLLVVRFLSTVHLSTFSLLDQTANEIPGIPLILLGSSALLVVASLLGTHLKGEKFSWSRLQWLVPALLVFAALALYLAGGEGPNSWRLPPFAGMTSELVAVRAVVLAAAIVILMAIAVRIPRFRLGLVLLVPYVGVLPLGYFAVTIAHSRHLLPLIAV